MSVQLSIRRFTTEEYHRMGEAGILSEDDRVELLDGEIVEMSPIGSRHASCVARLIRLLSQQLKDSAIVWVQNPIHLDYRSEPQPDVVILRSRSDFYSETHPGPEDVLLLIEVADSSGQTDRQIKLPLYARAGIREVWIIDLLDRKVEVYHQPTGTKYQSIQSFSETDHLAPQALPFTKIMVSEVLS